MNKNIVIVGHGLAGAVLAHTLIENQQSVVLIDAEMANSATGVSAGLINPLIGPKLNTPEDFASCMRENLSFFKRFASDSRQGFIEKIDLYRIFISSEQRNRWGKLTSAYKDYTLSLRECTDLGMDAQFGAGKTTAWKLKVHEFIQYSKNKLLSLDSYYAEHFQPEKWKDQRVVFCDGYRAITNRWFKHLPFAPAQGEVLKIRSDYDLNASNGTWHLAEKGSSTASLGSTWKHDDIESGPTTSARKEILSKMEFLPALEESKILTHKSGVRSGTLDRQPILGRHPKIHNYFLFNGFGSRGCTTISLSAKQFASYLCQDTPLPPHKDINRFSM